MRRFSSNPHQQRYATRNKTRKINSEPASATSAAKSSAATAKSSATAGILPQTRWIFANQHQHQQASALNAPSSRSKRILAATAISSNSSNSNLRHATPPRGQTSDR
jgi:hypothetical protein